MDAETPPIPAELLAVAQASPTLAELLRRLARGEPGSTAGLPGLVRRLLDGTASAEEQHARPLLDYMREGWRRSVRSARAGLDRGDCGEACFFVVAVLERSPVSKTPRDRLTPDANDLLAFDAVTRRAGWKDLPDSFAVVPYLKGAMRSEAQEVLAAMGEGKPWSPSVVRNRENEARWHARAVEHYERFFAVLTDGQVVRHSSERRELVVLASGGTALEARLELDSLIAHAHLTPDESRLIAWRLENDSTNSAAARATGLDETCAHETSMRRLRRAARAASC